MPATNSWFVPLVTRRFAEVGNAVYVLTAITAVTLSFGVGYAVSPTIGDLSMIAALPIWLVGAAIRYKFAGVPIHPSAM